MRIRKRAHHLAGRLVQPLDHQVDRPGIEIQPDPERRRQAGNRLVRLRRETNDNFLPFVPRYLRQNILGRLERDCQCHITLFYFFRPIQISFLSKSEVEIRNRYRNLESKSEIQNPDFVASLMTPKV